MRDTFIGLAALFAVIGGYFVFKSQPGTTPLVNETDHSVSRVEKSPLKISKISKRITRKVIHERTKHSQSRKRQNDGHHQGSSREASEVEKLPSIYEDQEGRVTQIDSSESAKSVYGVPVDAWVLSHRNSIQTEPADPKLAEGVRVFVGCVELKKEGAKELTKGDCAKIASANKNIQ